MSKQNQNATRALIAFIRNYNDLLEKQLQSVHATMKETVDGVMQGINQISAKTAQKKQQANEVIVNTYTNPDAETKKTMDAVQDEVNRILDAAAAPGAPTPIAGQGADDELRTKLRRGAGLFSKHMEALETLDGDLQNMLLEMMGALSRDDVISQRIEHVMSGMHAMQTSLTYILTDFETRCREGEVERFIGDLKSLILKTYTMEDEKKLHYQIFPEDKPKKKVAS